MAEIQEPQRDTRSRPARETSTSERLDYLDGWRGVAIALVLWAHFAHGADWIDSGRFGVDIFFCLSGLLMSNILFVKRVSLRQFYKRRISRIVPVFLLFLVPVFGASHWVAGQVAWGELVSTAVFLRTYLPATPTLWDSPLPIGHLWSLNAEEHSYIFLSLLASMSFLRRREWLILIPAGMAAIATHALYVWVPRFEPPSGMLGTEVVASHLLLSAGYFLIHAHVRRFVLGWMPLVALLAAGITYTEFAPWWSDWMLSPLLLAFAVNHLADTPALFRRLLATPVLRYMGVWSYSIYIWQQPFYTSRHALGAGMGFAGALAAGVLSFYPFENPIRAWLNRRW